MPWGMPNAPPAMTAAVLVQCIKDHAKRDIHLVISDQVKAWLDEKGIDWERPHGWRIRDAEDDEFASPRPRLIKWKKGSKPVAYSLAGWVQTRP